MSDVKHVSRWLQQIKRPVAGLVLLVCVVSPLAAHAVAPGAIIAGAFEAAKLAYQAYQAYEQLNGDETHDALMAAIAMVRQDLQNIQNAVADFFTAQGVACADAITIAFENFLEFNDDVKQQFTVDYINCATVLNNEMNVPAASRAHVDLLGRGFNVVMALEFFMHEYLGWETQGLLNLLEEGNQTIVRRLTPNCTHMAIEPDTSERAVTCTVYGGHSASDHLLLDSPFYAADLQALKEEAARDTSYIIAKAILEGQWLVQEGQALVAALRSPMQQFREQMKTALGPELQLASPQYRRLWCQVVRCD
jgi:hypothetical protein